MVFGDRGIWPGVRVARSSTAKPNTSPGVERSSRDTLVSEIMSSDLMTVAPTSSVEDCMELMTERHIRHLPVLEGGQLVGVISIGDVVKAVIADLAALVEQLDSYIRGR